MASRLPLPTLPTVDRVRLEHGARRHWRALAAARPSSRREWKLALWQLVFFPYWFWSDLPKPLLPEKDLPLPMGGPAGEHVKSRFRAIARRTWLQRTLTILARTLVLTILVAALWQCVELFGGPEVRFATVPWVGLVLLLPALMLIATSRPSNAQVARMLDRSFALQERMVTSLINIGHDIPAKGTRAGLRYLQVADAANALTAIRNHHAFRIMPPVRELVLAIIFALALASLYFLRGGGGEVPPLQPAIVPEFIPAAQRYVSGPEADLPSSALSDDGLSEQQLQELAEQSNAIRQDLMTLAGALEDHALTRSAAEAIAQGEYAEAVQELRQVAAEADELSQGERDSLATDLGDAAASMSQEGQGLSAAAESAAGGLREGGSAAEEGMLDVADAVEQSVAQLQSNDSVGQSLDQSSEQGGGQASSQQSQATGQPQSLFDDQTTGQENASSENGNQQDSGNPETADQQFSSQAGSGAEAGAGTDQEGSGGAAEQSQSDGSSGGASQASSEDATSGGGAPEGDSAPNSGPGESGAAQEASSGDDASDGTSSDSASDGGTSGSTGNEQLPDPAAPNVSESEVDPSGAGGAAVTPGGVVVLNRSPQGQAVPLQGSGNQSNLGGGGGVASGSGSSAQGNVAAPGPDSNHVPPEYRAIVEAYFSSGNE
ncbi:MAG: hypothetical protein KF883_10310 [Thermomicrobiales bacterium]|nr:hypothetical protein [Thermomicrobiales bacterium]